MVHGAYEVLVLKSISSTASEYASHFSRLRQSSSVIFHALSGSFCLFSKRLSCSSLSISSQNFRITVPKFARCFSISFISLKARFHSSFEHSPSTLSTRTLPYQLRSKIAICPVLGISFQNRQR